MVIIQHFIGLAEYYTIYNIYHHVHNKVTYLILRRILGYTNDPQVLY